MNMARQAVSAMAKREPAMLRRGKDFHRVVQSNWKQTAEGEVISDRPITKPNGRRGRIDIFVSAENDLVAVVEVKASRWDSMTANAVRRNVLRQARQIWDYIESQLVEGKDVSPGVIFPSRPKTCARLELIESLFDEQGIAVVWESETLAERRVRAGLSHLTVNDNS